MAAVGTPVCRPGDLAQGANRPERCFGPLPSPETVPESAHVDELWIVKDPSKVGGGNPTLGPRLYDPPAGSWERLARGDFEEYRPEPGSAFERLYEFNRAEWKQEGCGELEPSDVAGQDCSP